MAMPVDVDKKDKNAVVADINVTPMVDIMLVLLIIFMVITPMLQKGVSVDMAKATNPREMREADQDDAVVVAVARDGKIYLGSDQLLVDRLGERIQDLLAAKVDKTVYVKSDRRAKYGGVVDVVDTVRSAGVDTLGLLTDKIDKKKVPGI
ncbi:MAG: biopolymer transporter ExbD [Acidobacteria bacterium]|nr:biopolymer transporter ExbD [Acidobacteriota bacterium]MYC80493.1 biopolymer transporter ExbD [Acidobacteriota bacterium]